MKVFCAGMLVCDISINFVPLDIMSKDSYKINSLVTSCGGDALNVAVSLSKLNFNVIVSGRIGEDVNGKFILSECSRYKIDTSNVVFDHQYPTATSIVLVDTEGERHFLTNNEIFLEYKFEDIELSKVGLSDFIYFGSVMSFPLMDNGGITRLFAFASSAGIPTILDAAFTESEIKNNWFEFLSPIFQDTSIFFPSIREARKITKKENPSQIAECFKQFDMDAFGIKLGEEGCYVTDFQQEKIIPAVNKYPILNTTGAGDAFISGLIYGLSLGFDIFRCAEFGNVAAALKISEFGGKQIKFEINSILDLINEIY